MSTNCIEVSGALRMMERKSMGVDARFVTVRSISEIKDAVRELRESAPDSVLAELAEQKIEQIEQDPHSGWSRAGSSSDQAHRAR